MSYLFEMEWNSKWDWDNFVSFGSKAIESPRKVQLADWMFAGEGDIYAGSFNLLGGDGNSGASGSNGGHGSSAKSSLSASTDSSTINGIQTPNLMFTRFECSNGDLSRTNEMKGTEVSGMSSPLDVSVGSVESLMGLKLGKRTYFENSASVGNGKSKSFSPMPTPIRTTPKKTKPSGQNAPIPRCQVEDCNLDLSLAKEYHQKHRVCDKHSKCPTVYVGGLERRFCQQCSRFHSLSEFDEKKRSCRRRLTDHNARRRKPQQEAMQFNSNRLASLFYGGRQQLSFLLNNESPLQSSSPPRNSKFTITKGSISKSNGEGGNDEQLHLTGTKLLQGTNMQSNAVNGYLPSKNPTSEALNIGFKGDLMPSHEDAAQGYNRALSLLSNNSWSSCEQSIQRHNPLHENDIQNLMHGIPGVTLSSDLWFPSHQATHPHIQQLMTTNHYQDFPLIKSPYEAEFYSNVLN